MPNRAARLLRCGAAAHRRVATNATEQSQPALSALPWPAQLEDVTPEWLTHALRETSALPPGAAVRGFAASPLPCGPLARVHRLQLETTGDDSASTLSLIFKSGPPAADGAADGARQLAMANRTLERETGFYKAAQSEPGAPLAVPKPHFAACDKASGRAALLLQDCAAAGLVRADIASDAGMTGGAGDAAAAAATGTLPVGAAPALVRALAAQHARFWGGAPFALWRWLPEMNAAIVRDFEPALCEAALPEAIARFGAVIPVQLRGYLHGLPAAAGGTLLARLASGPRTLLHGDARLENIFVPPQLLAPEADDDQVAAATGRVRFVDYGDVAAGRGAYDVACLLSSALAPEDRAEAEHGLLGEYHDALSEGGVTAYSMYDAWEDYRFGAAYALVGAVAAAGAPGLEADPRAWDAAKERLRRAAEAAHDLGCAALLGGN